MEINTEGRTQLVQVLGGIQQEDLDWRQAAIYSHSLKPSDLLKKLSRLILQSEWTERVAHTFPALLNSILEECFRNGYENTSDEEARLVFKFNVTVALSKLVQCYPSALRFAETFTPLYGSPLTCLSSLTTTFSGNLSKKPKRHRREFTVEDAVPLLQAILILLKVLPIQVYNSWSVKSLLPLLKIGDQKLMWDNLLIDKELDLSKALVRTLKSGIPTTNDNLSLIIGMKYSIDLSIDMQFALEFQAEFELRSASAIHALSSRLSNGILLPENGIVQFPNGLVSIGGTLIKASNPTVSLVQQQKTEGGSFSLIQLGSTVSYIREIAHSLSSKFFPVCLVGPIGCGKSSLIKYTATLLGRPNYPHCISVQMSDQIDSRLLLGSYHSTDLPGQFVWKAGSLTKAVLRGYWIILEDIDSAPSDVIALFDGIIDTQRLSVPGYGEIDSIHPDFRVFSTSRTHTGKRSIKLGKHWKKIFIESMVIEEMKELTSELFPYLRPLADKLIGIFGAVIEYQSNLRGTIGRIVSLRDFLKFCRRIPPTLDFTQSNAAIAIFQEGCDLFIASFSNLETRKEVAEIIGTQLNLLRAKAEYFCTMHKPHINICSSSRVFTAGRYSVPMFKSLVKFSRDDVGVFSLTKRACNLLEILAGSVVNHEPVLLIGETGVGKTSCVQYLANVLQQKLIVVNLNRQSDSGDLLGGYKPVELKYIFSPIREEFETLFTECFDRESNSKFLGHIMTCYMNRRWKDLVALMIHVQKAAMIKYERNATFSESLFQRWAAIGHQLGRIQLQILNGEESPFAFSFIEGTLITAIKKGYWILLDEINLATSEMLQCLSGILDEDSDIHLWEKGDETPIKRHSNFHFFAAMNPSTDVGKKDLPLGLRNRFTEVYVEELTDPSELQILVSDYLKEMALPSIQIEKIVEFYLTVKSLSQTLLVDGMGKKPHFSLRTLCRALKISSMNLFGSVSRSLYESFCLSFLTQLDYSSHPVVESLVAKHVFGKVEIKSILNHALPCPSSGKYVQVEGYWIPQGNNEPQNSDKYILTPSIIRNLKDLARIVSAGRLPVLIQGETSVGKTSLIQYLAQISGNNCYRINNHQHTDLQEYVGSYQSDKFGKLVFTEGILVTAMRRGEWIILDELNLAPSEVLEALNRLLDDNRQLFITETGETITAQSRFMLFATQNPPGLYGGRKVLSRAFRNRFIELHFDEIPSVELETILHHRCNIPHSYSKKIIAVLRELQMRRKASAALEGKHGFATLRDLFRWAERYRQSGEQETTFYDWDQHLADEGYLVLAGKVRKPIEASVIQEVLQKHLKRNVDPNNLFSLHEHTSTVTRAILKWILSEEIPQFKHIVWTFQMRRLGVLIGSSLKFQEPILLVGETGGGKTSIVQLLAHLYNQTLYPVNCHMHSEGSDFLGGLRPVRIHQENDSRLFEWVNGPLVEAMEDGGIFLADEISLADDSVLERINSVLEPERTLLLAEKGDETPKLVTAHEKFHFIGTMNPGGDYGKKELSPALRNRLTEIWCEVSTDPADLEAIIEHNLNQIIKGKGIAKIMISFVTWLKNNELGNRCTISIRDYFSWTQFINHVIEVGLKLSLPAAIQHGACLAFLDGLGSGTTSTENVVISQGVKCQALEFLEEQIEKVLSKSFDESLISDLFVSNTSEYIGIGPFFIKKIDGMDSDIELSTFNLEAPTTSQNALRVLRAMQLKKPILLEGSPGVGKTALVTALGKLCHCRVLRINLSEQTDISDLFGADLPIEGGTGGQFEWRDGPLLQALKNSSWILLDELNLASQSVLEGLNACLDHRGEVYVPELNRTFRIGDGENQSRIFGCQNPVRQGGARKGLPRSFLNRFTQVFMDPLSVADLQWIMQTSFPSLPERWVGVMASFGESVVQAVSQLGLFGSKGAPWDFNLRDLIRWASLVEKKKTETEYNPTLFVDFIYGKRMRTAEDTDKILQLYSETCQRSGVECEVKSIVRCGQSGYTLSKTELNCGNGTLLRSSNNERCLRGETQLLVLQKQLPAIEALTLCLEMGWMPILVGPTKAGKTSVVKLVAEFTGHPLKIMTVSPEMDTIELLGGFEQADIYRKIDETNSGLGVVVEQLVKCMVRQKGHNLSLMDLDLLDLWSSLNSKLNLVSDEELLAQEEEMERIQGRLAFLESGVEKCRHFLQRTREHEKKISNPNIIQQIRLIEEELRKIRMNLKNGLRNGAFQWVDSILVKAIQNGEWLLIDGANRCTAAVLDRLNSLMEVSGSLLLSERGSIDGKIIEMKPHENFRLILTMDPTYGEISRAMRNRGVEIYMAGPEEITSVESVEENLEIVMDKTNDVRISSLLDRTSGGDKGLSPPLSFSTFGINWFDLDTLCKAEGLANPSLRKELVNLHGQLYETLAPLLGSSDRPHTYQIIETIRMFLVELRHGASVSTALQNALVSVYLKGNLYLDEDLKNQIQSILTTFEPTLNFISPNCPTLPVALPNFISTQLYRVWKEIEILDTVFQTTPSIISSLETMKKSVKNKSLLENLLFLSSFLRIGKCDVKAMAVMMGRHFSQFKTQVGEGLMEIFKNCEFGGKKIDLPWDSQWRPHFLAKYLPQDDLPVELREEIDRATKASLQLHEHLFRRSEKEEWTLGTLGYLAKSINHGKFLHDSLESSQLFTNLWSLLEKFDGILQRGLRSKNMSFGTLKSPSDYGLLWKCGIVAFLWRSRLFALSHLPYIIKNRNERLNSSLILIVMWLGEAVIPFLMDLDSIAATELKQLVTSCLGQVDHISGSSGTLLETGKRFRNCSKTTPFAVKPIKATVMEEVLELCFSGWSLSSSIRPERLISLLKSPMGFSYHSTVTQLCSRLSDQLDFTEEDVKILTELKKTIEKLRAADFVSEEGAEIQHLNQYVTGLVEYIRIDEKGKNSTFAHPMLQLVDQDNSNSLEKYLWWEEAERIRSLFMEFPNYEFLPMACLLPYFVSKILLDDFGKSFRVSTLGTRQVVKNSMERIGSILTKKLMSSVQTDEIILNELANSFGQFLQQIGSSIGSDDNFCGLIDDWLVTLCMKDKPIEQRMGCVGIVMLEAGKSLMDIGTLLPSVDPAVESEILVKYLREEIDFFETWVSAQRMYDLTETGRNWSNCHSTNLHPSVTASLTHLKSIYEKLSEAEKFKAHRPDPPNYDLIRQDLKQFSKYFSGSHEEICKIKKEISDIFEGRGTEEMVQHTINFCQIWIDSHRNFVKKMFKNFWYWDITTGYLIASIQTSLGLSLIHDSISRLKLGPGSKQKEEQNQLIEFPIPYRQQNDVFNKGMLSKANFQENFTKSLYTASLISFVNEIETEGCLSRSVLIKLYNLSHNVSEIWKYQEQEKQKQKELEDAMYVYKGKERSMELSEDAQEALDISNTFPDFVEDLIDLEVQNSLDARTDRIQSKIETNLSPTVILTSEDVNLFLKIHQRVMKQVKNHWISGKGKTEEFASDFVTPFLIRFQYGSQKLGGLCKHLGKDTENNFILGAALAVEKVMNHYEQPDFFRRVQIYDFYHDTNIEEVYRLSSVLLGLKKRVKELLMEWSEHPSLTKIMEIVARIESFRIDSPLMRFLTCLELLLTTSQEWESCAHKGVSISMYLSEITEIIISWRKLELQCWKNLLEITFQKEQSEAHKWWFHLYAVVIDVVSSPNPEVATEFLLNLHQFMETSSLGQFETRLSYLYNIHCHLISFEQINRKSTALQDYLHPYIWNTLNYYKQFQGVVASKLSALRSPIEKKIKDFVKISRWNDANYYALKQSVHKNQKMLNKFVKEWKKAMLTPVSTALIADLSGVDTQDKLWNRRVTTLRPKSYLINPAEMTPIRIEEDLLIALNLKRLGKLTNLLNKSQKIVKSVLHVDSILSAQEIETVEGLTEMIINSAHELQGLEVAEKTGEKRKKMLHNIHFRKRASLADLFKILQGYNLSYRRGLVHLTRDGNTQKLHRDFYTHPVDIAAGWTHLIQEFAADKDFVKYWEGCESYYQKCISRMAVMIKSFHSPSKELGPRIIERCKGFVVDLMEAASSQKDLIASSTKHLWSLRNLAGHNYTQGQVNAEFENIYQEVCRVEYETRQLKLLVQGLKNVLTEFREVVTNALSKVLFLCEAVKNTLKIYVDSVAIPNLHLKLMEGKIDLVESLKSLEVIRSIFRSIESETLLGHVFSSMASSIESFVAQAAGHLEERPPTVSITQERSNNVENFSKTAKSILQNVLITFQKLDKLKNNREKEMNQSTDLNEEVSATNLKTFLREEINCFEIEKLVNRILYLMRIMRQGNCTEFSTVFAALRPLLEQYSITAQFYLTNYIQFHRSTCKLLSVLLGIFAMLGSKGFCLPADYEEEAAAEGEEMDASSGMGMGEGETIPNAQDVSDRMESEDQLEDTLKEGETAPSADKDLNDEEEGVEMSEDFAGKQQEKDQREAENKDDDRDSESENEEEEELDKQMGDVNDDLAEKLDDQMWGGSSDEDDENLNEKDEEQGKGSNRQSEPELRAKDPTLEPEESEETPEPEKPNESKTSKEFNEQEDEELNDDQADPYHGQNIPEPESDGLDLPDDLNLDGAEPKDGEEETEENPFDLDSKEKEDITTVPEVEDEPPPVENMEDDNRVSEDEDPDAGKGVDVEKQQFEDDEDISETQNIEKEEETDGMEEETGGIDVDESEKGKEDEDTLENVEDGVTESEQKIDDKAEPSEANEGKSQDQTTVANEKAKGDRMQEAMDTTEEENSKQNDETASGQAESHDGTGHEGKSVKEDKNKSLQNEKDEEDASRKPGDTDKNRSLANDPKLQHEGANRLKTLETLSEDSVNEPEEESAEPDDLNQKNAELYQHVKDSEKSDAMTVDNSTREQAEKQKPSVSEKKEENETDNPELEDDGLMENSQEIPLEEIESHNLEFNLQEKQKITNDLRFDKVEKTTEEPMEVEVEGEKVTTSGAQRPADSTIETRFDLLEEWSREKEKVVMEQMKREIKVTQSFLTSEEEATSLTQWHELEGKTLHLAQELCEQLRLVLEPSQAARLKGDYKTGKRLNMRKVIPYIASGFRKDKIWLRRTQPSKREYQILLALDDSASMADNQSKQMAFSAVAVVARSLGLLEAGQLGVVGFGEDVQLLHPFEEPFTDFSGAKLIQRFTFTQRATRIAKLLDFTESLFEQAKESHSSSSSLSPEVAQLLLIISDGRGVSHEGSGLVKRAVRQAREKNIFVVFIVVDNPENKDSILDIRLPIFGKDGTVDIAKYMDHFPFPFYLILRDLSTLPSVLSDALRQWFELVTSNER